MIKTTLQQVIDMSPEERMEHIQENGGQLIGQMLEEIGSIDPVLRDEQIYRLIITLLTEHLIENEVMENLAIELISDRRLFWSIGEMDTDSVFTRSFSALWLAGLLAIDRETSYLEETVRHVVMERSATYLQQERDVRGFVEEKGWAHSIAHGADLAAVIAGHPLAEKRLIPVLLQGVSDSFWKGPVYTDDEDERLVAVIMALVKRGYPEEVLVEWIEQVFDRLELERTRKGYSRSLFQARTNTLQFMKTLYFALKMNHQAPGLQQVVAHVIQKWFSLT
ncbi:DUF2785 domain-containing protein [Sporosarcina sp. Te-1]|uniref:DUF2785 domain-containing protein n=1 Tax=Sporosarcina sp. Te-1 TaxID=2818390 RepID=UPI001A9F568C|nr:DUF2785 domain-containing protein [Sporosarcina sp. Te-1]QTD40065.1 DUF2785 domain-containing protein [Sporosarcina sp. Te-1]